MKINETIQIQFDFGELVATIEPPVKKTSLIVEEKFVFEFMDMLTAPIITFSASWADAIPNLLKRDISFSRMVSGMMDEKMATIPETVAYIMTRTLEAPMNHEWTNIYLWCSLDYMKTYRNKTDADFEDIFPPEKLSDYEKSLLKRLRVWIYEKRREVVKQRIKESKNKNTN